MAPEIDLYQGERLAARLQPGLSNAHSRPLKPEHSHGRSIAVQRRKKNSDRKDSYNSGWLFVYAKQQGKGPTVRMVYDQSMTKQAAEALTEPYGTKPIAVTKYL
jgi:hypothetical protein